MLTLGWTKSFSTTMHRFGFLSSLRVCSKVVWQWGILIELEKRFWLDNSILDRIYLEIISLCWQRLLSLICFLNSHCKAIDSLNTKETSRSWLYQQLLLDKFWAHSIDKLVLDLFASLFDNFTGQKLTDLYWIKFFHLFSQLWHWLGCRILHCHISNPSTIMLAIWSTTFLCPRLVKSNGVAEAKQLTLLLNWEIVVVFFNFLPLIHAVTEWKLANLVIGIFAWWSPNISTWGSLCVMFRRRNCFLLTYLYL